MHVAAGERPAARDGGRRGRRCTRDAGSARSLPPPWMSISAPRCSSAMAAHSTCQPGRPGPNGASHDGLARPLGAPQQRDRAGRACPAGQDRRRARRTASASAGGSSPATAPKCGEVCDREVDVGVDQVGVAVGQQLLDHRDDQRDRLDRADVGLRRQHAQGASCRARKRSVSDWASSLQSTPSRSARSSSGSSTSVTFWT